MMNNKLASGCWPLLIILVLLSLVNVKGDLVSSCPSMSTQCQNGGLINTAGVAIDCNSPAYVKCGSVPSQWYINEASKCQCPGYYYGTECQNEKKENCQLKNSASPPTNVNDTLVWDDSFWNIYQPYTKPLSCAIRYTPDLAAYSMRYQFARLLVNAMNSSIQVQVISQIARTNDCSTPQIAFQCTLSQCSVTLNQDNSYHFECSSKSCTACTAPECSTFAFIATAISSSSQSITMDITAPNATANFDGTTSASTTATVAVSSSTLSISFDLDCDLGQCVQQKYIVTPNIPPFIGYLSSEGSSYTITVAVVSVLTFLALMLGLMVLIFHRRDRFKLSINSDLKAIRRNRRESSTNYIGTQNQLSNIFNNREFQSYLMPARLRPSEAQNNNQNENLLQSDDPLPIESIPPTRPPAPSMAVSTPPSDKRNNVGIRVVLENLRYVLYKGFDSEREIIKDLSLDIPPNELVAVCGPSGAGKTSLLHILAGFLPNPSVATIEGQVKLLVAKNQGSVVRDRVSLVLQDELLLESQTVRESINFSARLRLDHTDDVINSKINKVLLDLNLNHLANSRIGNPETGGLSGGERRRVAMAIELVSDPGLLLMDEPLSGLDSINAHTCLLAIQNVCKSGCGALVTVHQASTRLLSLFDRVLVISNSGQLIYNGSPRDIDSYFNRLGYTRNDAGSSTDSEFLLELASDPREIIQSDLVDQLARLKNPKLFSNSNGAIAQQVENISAEPRLSVVIASSPDSSHKSILSEHNEKEVEMSFQISEKPEIKSDDLKTSNIVVFHQPKNNNEPQGQASLESAHPLITVPLSTGEGIELSNEYFEIHSLSSPASSFFKQISFLMLRSMKHIAREPGLFFSHISVTFVTSLFLGFLFYHVDFNVAGIQNRSGFLFVGIFYFSLTALSSVSIFLKDRARAHHEQLGGTYSPSAFFIAHVISDFFPLRLLPCLIFSLIAYNLVSLQTVSTDFILFIISLIMTNMAAVSTCLFISSLCASVDTATFVSVCILMFDLVFGGLLVNAGSYSSILVYLQYTSFCHYAYEIMFTNEFSGVKFEVAGSGIPTTVVSGDVFINNFGMNAANMSLDFLYLILFIFVPLFAASYIVAYRYYSKLTRSKK